MPRRRSVANSEDERAVTNRSDYSRRSRSSRRSRDRRSRGRKASRSSRSSNYSRSYSRGSSGYSSRSGRSRYGSTDRSTSVSSRSLSPTSSRGSRDTSRDSRSMSRKSSVDARTRTASIRSRSPSGARSPRSAAPRSQPKSPKKEKKESESEEEEEEEEELVLPPKLDAEEYERLLDDDPDRFGKQGADNLDDSDMKKVVKVMKEALDIRPTDDTYQNTPKGMKMELMPHQKHGLAWMLFREQQEAPGGILASVIHQWRAEIQRRLQKDTLKVLMLCGDKKDREDDPEKLAKADVVITSYSLVTRELHLLKDVAFERNVLDEAHTTKNRTIDISKAVCRLAAGSHWCLTGTPVHNDLWDLYSLVRFMRICPFDMEDYWKEFIANDDDKAKCANRLNVLTRSILLRRTKNQVDPITNKPLVQLPPKHIKLHDLTMEGIEANIYEVMFMSSQLKVRQMLEEAEAAAEGVQKKKRKVKAGAPNPFLVINVTRGKNKASCVLVMLLRLRQACVHMHLTKEAVDMAAFKDLDEEDDDILTQAMAKVQLGEGNEATKAEEVFEKGYLSCKMKKLMEIVEEVEKAGEKIVIVSQWATLLNLVSELLKKHEGRVTSITGSVPTEQRQERIDSFNQDNGGYSVLLLSLRAGGVGLNLVGGNHLVMVDLHWNPALEAHACDRIYRMGQTRPVYIHRLTIAGTIEQRVLEIQEKKKLLAESVLSGAASKKTVLSNNDIEFLFDLRGKK